MARHPKLTKAALADAIAEAARCKSSRRHRLEPIPPPVGSPRPQFGSLLVERCELCGTLRYAVVSRLTGDLLGGYRYDHPDAYAAAGKDGHDPAWWRSTWWDQLDPSLFLDAEPGGHVKGQPVKRAANVVDLRKRKRA